MDIKDRAKGAFIGSLIGEALGVGPHWFYDLEEQYKHYGKWIDDYTKPLEGRYHEGLEPGELSQQGWIVKKMAENLVKNNGYSSKAFYDLMDNEILPELDGTPMGGIGGYTSQVMRHVYQKRVVEKESWDNVASTSDDTESLERNVPTAIFYSNDLAKLSKVVTKNVFLTQSDNMTTSMSVAFNIVLASLIQGESLDETLSMKLMKKVYSKELPFHAITSNNLGTPKKGKEENVSYFASPDALLTPSYVAKAAIDETISIEPAWKVSLVYGMPCAIYHVLPASYYLGARFKDDFKEGVLHALNGGGQNQIRAMLTGALIGAQVGFRNIPDNLVNGLKDRDQLLKLADDLVDHL